MSLDFLIIGSMKGGTTSLCDYLLMSKDIYIPEIKEPHYFVASEVKAAHARKHIPSLQWVSSDNAYDHLFANATQAQLKGEASVSYFYYIEEFIKATYSKYGRVARGIKIILVIRDPVERAISQAKSFIQYDVVNGRDEIVSFVASHAESKHFVYDVFGSSEYAAKFQLLRDAFDDVFVLKGEYLRNSPELAMQSVSIFLGIDDIKVTNSVTTNVSGIHKYLVLAKFDKYARRLGLFKFVKSVLGPVAARKIKDSYYGYALTRNIDLDALKDHLNVVLRNEKSHYDELANEFKL